MNILSSNYLQNEDRQCFRFEVAWDSSLHNSILLNRVTPSKDWIYITITSYIEVENCIEPVCITKDLCLVFYPRDAKITLSRSFRNFLSGNTYRSSDANKVSSVYNFVIRKAIESSSSLSPGLKRRAGCVVDTSSLYVRGEEMLKGWRPRSDSLIFEHQWELERISRLEEVGA